MATITTCDCCGADICDTDRAELRITYTARTGTSASDSHDLCEDCYLAMNIAINQKMNELKRAAGLKATTLLT